MSTTTNETQSKLRNAKLESNTSQNELIVTVDLTKFIDSTGANAKRGMFNGQVVQLTEKGNLLHGVVPFAEIEFNDPIQGGKAVYVVNMTVTRDIAKTEALKSKNAPKAKTVTAGSDQKDAQIATLTGQVNTLTDQVSQLLALLAPKVAQS